MKKAYQTNVAHVPWYVLPLTLLALITLFGSFTLVETIWHAADGTDPFWLQRTLSRTMVSIAAGFIVSIFVLRAHRLLMPTFISEDQRILDSPYPMEDRQAHFNRLYTRMRWAACVSGIVVVLSAYYRLEIIPADAVQPLLLLLAGYAVANLGFTVAIQRKVSTRVVAELQLLCDLAVLLLFVHHFGGAANPFIFISCFLTIMAAILLEPARCYGYALLQWTAFSGLALAESSGIVTPTPLPFIPAVHDQGLSSQAGSYALMVMGLHFLLLFLVAYFTTAVVDRLRAEERHGLAVRQRSDLILEAMGIGFAILDRNGEPDWFNRQMKLWLGIPEELSELRGLRIDHWTGGSAGVAEQTYRDGRVRSEERQLVDSNGSIHFYHVTTFPLLGPSGDIYEVVELVQETTEAKRIETEMAHSNKLAALGVMAAGFAHDIGNPLASISTRLRLLEEDHEPDYLRESLALLQKQIARIAGIVHGLTQLGRPPENRWGRCSVNGIVTETLGILQFHKGAEQRRIGTDLAYDLPSLDAAGDQLAQVFLNLGLNALEAMPEGGQLTVRTFVKDDAAYIAFVDNGPGIPQEHRDQIFDTFYTTKSSGMGLGLSIAQNIVSSHGGRIDVEDHPGGGAVVTVVLPLSRSGAQNPLKSGVSVL